MLTRDDIAAMDDGKVEKLWIPEWESEVRLRVMTGEERDYWDQSGVSVQTNPKSGEVISLKPNLINARARLACMTLCDEQGKRLFPRNGRHIINPADLELLTGKSALALERIYNAAKKLNALDTDSVEEARGNSSGGQSGSSGSASPLHSSEPLKNVSQQ